MANELEGLAEPVRDAFVVFDRDLRDGSVFWHAWQLARAELLRLARENAELARALDDRLAICGAAVQRAERAESELAALRKRVGDAPVMRIDPVGDGAYWSMADGTSINELTALNGKRVRIVEESV